MGQLSDPYDQGEEPGITISGLPGELDEPGEPAGPDLEGDAAGDGGEVVVHDLGDWSELGRTAVGDRLREAGIPHGWQGASLEVAAADDAAVANVLDIVEGEAAPALDPDRDQVAYDLSEWDDDLLDSLVDALDEAGIVHGWAGDELFVHSEDEQAVDTLVDRVAHPHELAAEPDDGPAGAELLGEIFVAADRLQRDGEDQVGTAALLDLLRTTEGAEVPYGLGEKEWDHLCARVAALGELLRAEVLDEEAVVTSARDLRTALRPYV